MRQTPFFAGAIVAAVAIVAVLASFAFPSPARALHSIKVAEALAKPVCVVSPPGDPRLFILEQRGWIRILESGEVLETPFLDITAQTQYDGTFQGILGLAFHPDYAVNGYFFVNYTMTGGDTRISRFRVSGDPNLADPSSEVVILTVPQPNTLHNGGYLAFGPSDGYLYIGMGDGGPEADPDQVAQDPSSLLGKLLRIDVDSGLPYAIPADNPFVGTPGYREEIWALGLREPWGMTFDRQTHDLWIADVGDADYEEINFQPASSSGGENYGWSLMEGLHCFNPPTGCDEKTLTLPIHEYSHSSGCSVNGGYVYRGTAIPGLQGTYFYSDYCTKEIWSFRYDGSTMTELTNRSAELAPTGGDTFSFLAGFGEDAAGELYIIDWHWNEKFGELYKISPSAADVGEAAAPPTHHPRLLGSARPDPFTTNTVLGIRRAAPRIDVWIRDVSGRTVRTWNLRNGARTADASDVIRIDWDGTDRLGNRLPSGVYFVEARAEGPAGIQHDHRTLHIVR